MKGDTKGRGRLACSPRLSLQCLFLSHAKLNKAFPTELNTQDFAGRTDAFISPYQIADVGYLVYVVPTQMHHSHTSLPRRILAVSIPDHNLAVICQRLVFPPIQPARAINATLHLFRNVFPAILAFDLALHDRIAARPTVNLGDGEERHGDQQEAQHFVEEVAPCPHHGAIVQGLLHGVVEPVGLVCAGA